MTKVVLIAACENYIETEDRPCDGWLEFRQGMSQAACEKCRAWCGIAVARWVRLDWVPS